jgi:hypothetical protein
MTPFGPFRPPVACDHENFTALRQLRITVQYQYLINQRAAGNHP